MATKTATPWGAATLVEELSVPQRAGEKRFATIVQLLENERGERLLRFAYSTGGTAGAARSRSAAAISSDYGRRWPSTHSSQRYWR